MTRREPILLALAKRKRCVETSLAGRGKAIDPSRGALTVCEPIIHTVRITRRPHDEGRRRLADWVDGRYRDHAPSQLNADSCPALLIDVLA